jgi:hypothetical protein
MLFSLNKHKPTRLSINAGKMVSIDWENMMCI